MYFLQSNQICGAHTKQQQLKRIEKYIQVHDKMDGPRTHPGPHLQIKPG